MKVNRLSRSPVVLNVHSRAAMTPAMTVRPYMYASISLTQGRECESDKPIYDTAVQVNEARHMGLRTTTMKVRWLFVGLTMIMHIQLSKVTIVCHMHCLR